MKQLSTLQSSGNAFAPCLGDEIHALGPWFHNLHLPGNIQTAPDHPLGDFPYFKWQVVSSLLPTDLNGWRVLDVGCNAGFYSFQLAQRGAQVLGIDSDPHYLRQAKWAQKWLDPEGKTNFEQRQIYDLARMSDQSFDLIFFMGVFYHLRYPTLAIDILKRKCRKFLLFQSLTLANEFEQDVIPEDLTLEERLLLHSPSWPKMYFIEKKMAGDPTNWWIPNTSCVLTLFREAGFQVMKGPIDEIILFEKTQKSINDSQEMDEEYRSAVGI